MFKSGMAAWLVEIATGTAPGAEQSVGGGDALLGGNALRILSSVCTQGQSRGGGQGAGGASASACGGGGDAPWVEENPELIHRFLG